MKLKLFQILSSCRAVWTTDVGLEFPKNKEIIEEKGKPAQNSISLPNMDLYETIFVSLTKYVSSCFCVVCLDVKAKV